MYQKPLLERFGTFRELTQMQVQSSCSVSNGLAPFKNPSCGSAGGRS